MEIMLRLRGGIILSATAAIAVYTIAAFAFAAVVLLKREAIHERLRRPLALIALGLTLSAFVFVVLALMGAA